MSENRKWDLVSFIVFFFYGVLIFSLGPFSGPYTNPPEDRMLTYPIILLLGLATAIVGFLFSRLVYRIYKKGGIAEAYASAFFVFLILVLSMIDGPAQGDTDLLLSFLTYYLPGNLITIPLQPIIPAPPIFYFSVVTFSWLFWGLFGILIGYLSKRIIKS